MRYVILILILFSTYTKLKADNGGNPSLSVTLCSGKTMSWEDYQLYKALRSNEYDLEIESYSDPDFSPSSYSFFNNSRGSWSSVINMPLIPVAAANMPDGRLVTWSAWDKFSFGGANGRTWTAIFDPRSNHSSQFEITNTGHDMFCSGISTLPDGRILVTGGSNSEKTSIYDPFINRWSNEGDMEIARGYQSQVTLESGATFIIGGSWSGGQFNKHSEIWTEKTGWYQLPGVKADVITNGINSSQPDFQDDYFPWLWPAPNGKLFHAGPGPRMHWIDTDGTGGWNYAGNRGNDVYSLCGMSVMYDVGKILKMGGAGTFENDTPANGNTFTIDINSDNPQVKQVENLDFSRVHGNAVVLPNGQVFAVGGTATSKTFSDDNSRLTPELWDPNTEQWTSMQNMQVPRNYHSVAILLEDGRIFVGGGGLCGDCAANHANAEIFSPPYLFTPFGTLATRPVISSAPTAADYNSNVFVNTDSGISSFSLVRMSGATHSTNNEQRRIPLSFSQAGNNQYQLAIPGRNLLPPGRYMLFAMNANGTPSIAKHILIGEDINDCTQQARPNLGGQGLTATYFNNTSLSNPVVERLDPTVNFNWGTGSPGAGINTDNFSARWEGFVEVPRSGYYTFYTGSDDGVRLWVKNKAMVDNWTDHGTTEDVGMIYLSENVKYSIKMEYYDSGGNAVSALRWSGPGVNKEIIPSQNLFPLSSNQCQNNGGDTDGDGICNDADNCPSLDNALIGTSCNDNNPNTQNDIWRADCQCRGDVSGNVGGGNDNVICTGTDYLYTITSVPSGNVLDVYGGSTQAGANVQQWGSNGTPAQQWYFQDAGNDQYRIININSNHALGVVGSSNSSGANVEQATLSGSASQRWQLGSLGNGQYTIINVNSGLALDVDNASLAAGANIQQWTANGTGAQLWSLYLNSGTCNATADSDGDGVNDANDQCPGFNDNLIGTACNDNDPCTIGETYDANCGCSGGTFVDSDNDGICDANDNTNGSCFIGQACNDNDVCTINDVYDANCNCSGTFVDSDNDGICDANDNTNGNCFIGQACNDNDVCTINDVYDANCNCSGTFVDTDNDGICDALDNTNGNCVVGQACNDNDVCTINDVFDANCNCSGTYMDTDNDGICDAIDNTNGNCFIGQACNDNDVCTINDVYDANCNCSGTYVDSDNDGICDALDNSNGNCVVGQACNDNDVCTINDVFDANCNCSGTYVDSDNDGICDALDTNDPPVNNGDCEVFSNQDFERDLGPWQDGGADAFRFSSSQYANSGTYSLRIRDNSNASSSYFINNLEISQSGSTFIEFSYLPVSMEPGEDFLLELGTGNSYTTVQSWVSGQDFTNNVREQVRINLSDLTSQSVVNLRIRCDASSNYDLVYLDDILIETCGTGSGSGPDCIVGQACEDGDPCTLGEALDNNCNCVGGQAEDADQDGFCAALDQNDNDPCIPDNTDCIPDTNGPCTGYDTENFESGLGIWNDGGVDAFLGIYAESVSGNYAFRLRDNSGSASSIFTDPLNFSTAQSVNVKYSMYMNSLEPNEDLLLEVSIDGGATFRPIRSWISGTDFQGDTRIEVDESIPSSLLSSNTVIRIRCDASSNYDRVYVDDIVLEVCSTNGISDDDSSDYAESQSYVTESMKLETINTSNVKSFDSYFKLYPNPVDDVLNIEMVGNDPMEKVEILSVFGQLITDDTNVERSSRIDVSSIQGNQAYLLKVTTQSGAVIVKKFLKI